MIALPKGIPPSRPIRPSALSALGVRRGDRVAILALKGFTKAMT